MSQAKDRARAWVRSVVVTHLPRTARRYRCATYVGEASVSDTLGIQVDMNPIEGTVVEVTNEWVLVKEGRKAEFLVAQINLLEFVPTVGSVVRVTPYARRGFDGRRLDAPQSSTTQEGVTITTHILGEWRSKLPIDRHLLKCEFLNDMIEQIQELKAGDGIRTLAQVLVDAGASQETVQYVDPDDGNIIATPPSLKFRITTAKHDGWLEYRYDRAMDTYSMRLTSLQGNEVSAIDNVYFDDLSRITVEWVDDGSWRIAKVETLKPAPRAALAG